VEFTQLQPVGTSYIGRGIYRLYEQLSDQSLRIVYVGQASCITLRVAQHAKEQVKVFTHFDYVLLPDIEAHELDMLEATEIFYKQPEFNYSLPRTERFKRLPAIAHRLRRKPREIQELVNRHGLMSFLGLYDLYRISGLAEVE